MKNKKIIIKTSQTEYAQHSGGGGDNNSIGKSGAVVALV